MKYYFLGASLPDLQLGYPPDFSFQDFDFLLKQNLSESDYDKVKVLRRFYDIQNIREFWHGGKIDERGNFNENELEDALLTRMGFPDYVYSFMESHDTQEKRLKHFPKLVVDYFKEEMKVASPFFQQFLQFERDWRLVLAGFRAKQHKRDITLELQYEDLHDELVGQMLAQKDSNTYEPPTHYEDLKGIFEEHGHHPMEMHRAICEYRFNKVEGFFGVDVFSLDRIIAYMVQLILVERWMELDRKIGLEIVDQLVKVAL